MVGTVGNETINGGNGDDTIDAGAGSDTVAGGVGNDSMMGGAGADSLSAADGNDTLIGGSGNDSLAGGRGADTFVFSQGFGHDVVGDFAAGTDKLSFQGVAGIASFSDVMAHAVQSGASVIITDTAGDTVQLTNVQLSSLHSTDFLFA
jgi:Ca2+-binding RTX toxin-like protein